MHNKSKRVLWLLNHVTLMKTEVPIILAMGYEVFTPKIIPSKGFRSGAVDYSYDKYLSVPDYVLDALNSTDFYGTDWPESIVEYINKYFSVVFIMPVDVSMKNGLQRFKGVVLLRAFGLEAPKTYAEAMAYIHPSYSKWVYAIRDRFWFASAYEQLKEIEPRLLSDRDVFLPIALPQSFFINENTWTGENKQILFVCPSIETDAYYKSVYLEFKKTFGDLPHVIVGKQDVPVDDQHVVGYVSDEALLDLMRQSAVMYYHSHEPRHIHYHPIEAFVVGTPVVMYEDNLASRMAGGTISGAVSSIEDARNAVESILVGDASTIESVRAGQSTIIRLFSEARCLDVWKQNFYSGPIASYVERHIGDQDFPVQPYGRVPRDLMLLPNEILDTTKTLEDGIDFSSGRYPHFVEYADGLSSPDEWGAWSDGNQIEISLSQTIVGSVSVEITGGAYGSNINADVKIEIGSSEKVISFDTEPWHAKTHIVEFDVSEPANRIIIHIPHPIRLNGGSNRDIGIGLSKVSIKRLVSVCRQPARSRWLSRMSRALFK